MKRIYLKRILSVSLAAVMAVTMVGCGGCGKKKSDDVSDEQASHDAADYVFKDNRIELGENVDTSSISALGKFGDKLYAVITNVTDEGENKTTVYTFNKDGSDVKTIDLASDVNNSLYNAEMAEDGSIYALEVQYSGYYDGGMGFGGEGGFEEGPTSSFIIEDDTSIDMESGDDSSDEVDEEVTEYAGEDGDDSLAEDAEEADDADDAETDDAAPAEEATETNTEETSSESTEGGDGELTTSDDGSLGLESMEG